MAEHCDCAPTTTACDPGSVEACLDSRLAHESNQLIRAWRTKTARRIAGMRLVHQLAYLFRLCNAAPVFQSLSERLDTRVFINRMSRRLKGRITPICPHAGYRVACSFVPFQKSFT